jgi:hypothetical protein
MSLNLIPLKPVEVIDPLLNFSSPQNYGILNGGSEVSYNVFPAQNPNANNITITCNPPDEKVVIDPRMYIKTVYNLTFTGTVTSGNLLQVGVTDAPRAYPLAQTTSTLEAKLNGTSITTNLNEYFSSLIRYSNYVHDQDHDLSSTPAMLDQFQNYSDGDASNRNPLSTYNNNTAQAPRGSFSGLNILTNTSTGATATLTVYEPIFLAPFYYKTNYHGISGIRTMQLTWTFGPLSRIWSHFAGNPSNNVISNIAVSISTFEAHIRYITPKILEQVPRNIILPYEEVQILPNNVNGGTALAPNATKSITMNAINLEAIPKRVVFVVRESDSELNYNTSDTFARIDQVSINWANNQGKLSSANSQDLYQIAVRNGLNMSWDQWNKYCGSVLALDIGKDIGLGSLDAPGLLSNPQLSATINITNINQSRSIIFTLFAFIIYEGTISIMNGMVQKQIAVINTSDIVKAQQSSEKLIARHPHNYYGGKMYGNSLIGNIKDALGTVWKVLSKDAPGFEDRIKVAKKLPVVGDILELAGMGMKKKSKKKGKGMVVGGNGGALLSRNDLLARM